VRREGYGEREMERGMERGRGSEEMEMERGMEIERAGRRGRTRKRG
jgi:hypothetical protein